jgi:hypothetical protein
MDHLESFVQVKKVYRGEVRGKFIYLNRNALVESKAERMKLTRGQTYLILLRPSAESMKVFQGEYVPGWDSLSDEEILAIVELK